jgi:hypothetical protein
MDGEVCIANIGASQRRRRFWPGVAALAAGVLLTLATRALGLTSFLYAPSAVLVFVGFAGVLQARAKT